eukprot:CAMPEP_0170320462 /NCGR_PEP_ID=MMETSP0116_2-20130129/60969_1 /TAXON_ID=400756 /ORGANISM="Durinskia baltica, Strain CSIRO CS-38" /LENGTH=58 /DNA_ID=CAMNT_0010573241 /DNA_START=39 /DNA_END=212 /DNA_ORIENTATION=+
MCAKRASVTSGPLAVNDRVSAADDNFLSASSTGSSRSRRDQRRADTMWLLLRLLRLAL